MKKTISIVLFVLSNLIVAGQISVTKIVKPTSSEPYDSINNFIGDDVFKYIGQAFYVNGKPKDERSRGYEEFYTEIVPFSYKSKIYKSAGIYEGTKYDELVGKYFTVIAVHRHPFFLPESNSFDNHYFIELIENGSLDTVFYKYDSRFGSYSFPFIVMGYFEKQKQKVVGEKYVFSSITLEKALNIETGNIIKSTLGEVWICTDLTIEEDEFEIAIIVENSYGEKTIVTWESAFGKYTHNGKAYTLDEANKLRNKFKERIWLMILDGKIEVGFTEEMVLLSWGEPRSINTASYGDQWVYPDQYLYFKNGRLTSYN